VGEAALQWVSREHFRVELAEGQLQLVPLSSNSLWLARGGQQVEARRGHTPLPLASGDRVLLYTGASDGTPEGPGCRGTLHWTLVAAAAPGARAKGALGSP